MKMSAIVIGFLIVLIVRGTWGRIRLENLQKVGKSITLDDSSKIVLRSSIWSYFWPILFIGFCLILGVAAVNESNQVRIFIYGSASVFCFCGSVFLFYYQMVSRITIFDGALICIDGFDRWEVKSEDIVNISISGFAIYIKKQGEKNSIKIPLYFNSSELILAFFYQVAAKNKIWIST
jgi:hypothetical protein